MKVYQISGLGSNHKAFERLNLLPEHDYHCIPYLQPEENEGLHAYVLRMAKDIPTDEPFILMGLSFGGIIAQEIHKIKPARHCILLSTVKSREEMPALIRAGKPLHVQKWLPTRFFSNDKGFSYAFFRDKFLSGAPKLDEFFTERDPHYLRWSMAQVAHWNPEPIQSNYTHIHGNNDLVFPSTRIANAEIVEGGSHLMVLQKPKIVSEKINAVLAKHGV